jgi:mandelate racemase
MEQTSSPLVIQNLRARAVMAPLARPITTSSVSIPAAPLVLIDLFCDQGITGQAYIFGYTELVLKPLVQLFDNRSTLIKGEPVAPLALAGKLNKTFCLLGRQGLLGMALSGLDMAMWDALGKATDMPVARLLGANCEPITCYDSHGIFNPESSPQHLEQSLELGFKAVNLKVGGGPLQADVSAIKIVREVVGPDVKIMVDYNQSLTVPEAIERIRHLEPFDLHCVEEPVRAEDLRGHADVRNACSISIQTGENWWFAGDAARAFDAGASDYAMPDIMKVGGISGWLQVAALAEAASKPVSSHLFVEASAHALAATPCRHMLEYMDIAGAMLAEPYEVSDGTVCPRGPGLGMTWDEHAVEEHLL